MAWGASSNAQQRSGYFMGSYDLRHEINPAFQPDSSYWSLPLLGNTSAGMQSTVGMGDILFEKSDGTLATFMSKGTISKDDLMNAVGNGVKAGAETKLTMLSMGRRVNTTRYQTASISIKATAATWLPRDLFDCMKEMENRDYILSRTNAKASLYMEIAAGESRRIDKQLTVGAKIKLLLGLMNVNAELRNMHLNMAEENNFWSASGMAEINVAGMKYKTEKKAYASHDDYYEQINGIDVQSPGVNGIGAAIDAGATYKLNDKCTFSAAVTDVGFIVWTNNNKAVNNGEPFRFDGFKEVSIEHESANTLKKQWHVIKDDIMDLLHLESRAQATCTKMLGATLTVGAEYDLKEYCNLRTGALLTQRIDGKYSWTELRLNGTVTPITDFPLDIAISPAYSTFGFSGGLMANYYPNKKMSIFLGSDCLFFKVNPQMIPTSLNGTLQFGMTFRM